MDSEMAKSELRQGKQASCLHSLLGGRRAGEGSAFCWLAGLRAGKDGAQMLLRLMEFLRGEGALFTK